MVTKESIEKRLKNATHYLARQTRRVNQGLNVKKPPEYWREQIRNLRLILLQFPNPDK